MRLAWCTDVHLNFVDSDELVRFARRIGDARPDAVVLTGDISEAPSLEEHLTQVAAELPCPIYFVLGNHDFYRGSVRSVRAAMRALSKKHDRLAWLPTAGVVALSPSAALIGHDGWYDGRFGDYSGSRVLLNDYLVIDELAYLSKSERLARIQGLAGEAAEYFASALPGALNRFAHVVVATHVPPFKEACWYAGKISDDDWLPHFSSRVVGEALAAAMRARPDRRMTVLCGHTHGRGT